MRCSGLYAVRAETEKVHALDPVRVSTVHGVELALFWMMCEVCDWSGDLMRSSAEEPSDRTVAPKRGFSSSCRERRRFLPLLVVLVARAGDLYKRLTVGGVIELWPAYGPDLGQK
ncbi:hypothetical protein M2283_000463 [Streptomyces pseudovenezuelae]|uniref:Uncharacterized protein n=1 Tax=Streptomyces pseudovenezuelae TaxID=67350 RepID=A0ABT6LBM0_9ACTN|nr:hypothetical protein [Streptomyces pseudovenezuelae]